MDENQIISAPAPTKQIHKAIAAIMGEVGGVAKGRKNTQQNYSFRGIADVYLACQPVMAKHGVHVVPETILAYDLDELRTRNDTQMWRVRIRVRFRFFAEDGSSVYAETLGEAMDMGDKASNKAMSAAMKYALVQTFALPEEDPSIDTETQSPETVAKAKEHKPVDAKPADKPKRPPEEIAKVNSLATALQQAGVAEALPWVSERLGRNVGSSEQITVGELDSLLSIARALLADKKGGAK